MKTQFTLLFFVLLSVFTNAQTSFIRIQSIEEWEEMLELSRESKRLLFVWVTSPNCEPCTEMLDETLQNAAVNAHIQQSFIPVVIDNSTSLGRRFALSFNILELPSSVWMTGSEFVWQNIGGKIEASEFLSKSENLRDLIRNYPNQLDYALNGGDSLKVNEWFDLLYLSSVNHTNYESALIYKFQNVLSWDSLQSPAYWPFITTYVTDINSNLFRYISLDHQDILGADFPWEDYYESLYSYNFNRAVEEKDSALVLNMEAKLLPTKFYDSTATATDTALTVISMWQSYFLQTGRFNQYLEYSDTALSKVHLSEDELIAQVDVLRQYSLSETSINSALKWVNHTLESEESVNIYIMKADMLIVLGRLPKATEALIEAEKLSPNSEQRELIDYLDYIIRSQY